MDYQNVPYKPSYNSKEDEDEVEAEEQANQSPSSGLKLAGSGVAASPARRALLQAAVFVVVVGASLLLLGAGAASKAQPPTPELFQAQLDRDVAFRWNAGTYASSNASDSDQVDAAWDAFDPTFGFVALHHDQALAAGVPPTFSLHSDREKGVFMVQAYHLMHCVVSLRQGYLDLSRRGRTDVTAGHVEHCADVLRQFVQCQAPADPLYTWGHFTTGDGQEHACRNWGDLRRWVREHQACDAERVHRDGALREYGPCPAHDGLIDA